MKIKITNLKIIKFFIIIATLTNFNIKAAQIKEKIEIGQLTELIQAVIEEDIDKIKDLIKSDNNLQINAIDCYGNTGLHWACERNNLEIVRLLVDKNADINITNNDGSTPLVVAIQEQNKDIINLLLKKSANLESRTLKGKNRLLKSLSEIAQLGNANYVKLKLIERHGGLTPLMIACRAGNAEIIKLLVDAKANCHAEHISLSDNGEPEIESVDSGKFYKMKTVMSYVINKIPDETANALGLKIFNRCRVGEEFVNNLKDKNFEAAKKLLDQNFDIESHSAGGRTALHWAVHHKNVEMVDFLLKKGAYVHPPERDFHTPIFWCVNNKDTTIAQMLINAGADINDVDENVSVMQKAMREGNFELVKLLIGLKADVNKVGIGQSKSTPLMAASRHGHLEILKLLLDSKADPNFKEHLGTNAIMASFQFYREVVIWRNYRGTAKTVCYEIIKHLVEAQADINKVENVMDYTALHMAAQCYDQELIKVLLALGADKEARDRYNRRPANHTKTDEIRKLLE